MPRTSTLDCPGCPPLRALTFDELGLIKVVEARGKQGRAEPKVVERWGDPDSSKCVLAASIDDRNSDPLLAVARRNGTVEVLNPLNGDLRFSVSNASINGVQSEDDPVAGLHLFAKKKSELASRSCTLLTCTTKGNASIRSFEVNKSAADVASTGSSRTWSVGGGGSILCSKVDGSENYFLSGGKRVEMNVWDLESCAKIWTAKPPPKNSLGIFTPTWFTSATFLSKDDHRKFVAGTNSHEVRLFDISAQRRPVISFDFRETAIKSVAEDLDGYTIYVGNGSGDLASFDIRTGKLLGCFLGKCSGSIRSIARHPEFPVIASCGLDSYLRLWNVKTRQLLSAVHLKQHLTNVLFDSNFADEG
ncbi:WD repeat-containing protein 74 isoform X3 [Prunus persica]|uniref:WD repeat-containing protein 74 isoform X3 n=1 Tax=Prunus persica TaxID=3760 RepID=UPI0009AB9737|nr:WD repeat-containing protein 74 isoform X3 [Prunus persica]